MAWTERQHAMLRALGLRAWGTALPTAGAAPEAASDAAPVTAGATGLGADAQPRRATATGAGPAAAQKASVAPAAPAPRRPQTGAVAPPAPVRAGLSATAAPAAPHADWPALRAAVAACTACGLAATRTQTVFGVGHEQAHWMVVGEAPGEQEDLEGEPFVGAAGQLLDRMLAALQLTRAADGDAPAARRVYIANTLKCRPPRNRNPQPQELAQCEPFLVRQIELLRPRLIVAMGAFAVRMLLRSDQPVGRLRGQVHRYHGVPLVVTYHPAYLLRSPLEKARAWEDLCLAAAVAEEPAA